MKTKSPALKQLLLIVCIAIGVAACGGEEVEGGGFAPALEGSGGAVPTGSPDRTPAPVPPTETLEPAEAARFLSQATFGPTQASIDQLTSSSLETWFTDQLDRPASLHLSYVLERFGPDGESRDENNRLKSDVIFAASDSLSRVRAIWV